MKPITLKKDKRSEAEKNIDESIDRLAKDAKQPHQVDAVLDLMDKRKKLDSKDSISPNTIATVSANLLGIGMILYHEKVHVISSKALGFVFKGRV